MNHVILIGRLTRPVNLKEVGTTGLVVNNVIAISRTHGNNNGEVVTDFIPIIAWGRQAQLLARFCQKGHRVGIYGRMQSRSYKNGEGKDVYVIECLVNDLTLLEKRPDNGSKDRKEQVKKEEPKQDTAPIENTVQEPVATSQ
ncbi:single-stranded DNA-binding protein [Fundicoccus culcitae]|uniref:Single-stranded DNA-binding protein n=1 Tax=Fundicoccus culcitae TaxID=2969821 RepID=A0ABY5P350_9LACT|nr:single-stranded DNA-binding protein [Fundicoccus culcitae]UUX32915.1 single-stranded DNA-binding protein [Fundicoccus culcitae]